MKLFLGALTMQMDTASIIASKIYVLGMKIGKWNVQKYSLTLMVSSAHAWQLQSLYVVNLLTNYASSVLNKNS